MSSPQSAQHSGVQEGSAVLVEGCASWSRIGCSPELLEEDLRRDLSNSDGLMWLEVSQSAQGLPSLLWARETIELVKLEVSIGLRPGLKPADRSS